MKMLDRYDSLFQYYGKAHGVPWRILKAQAYVESAMNPNAESWTGAQGLTQFMPATWKEWAERRLNIPKASVWNPEHAIAAQAAYMRWLLTFFNDDIDLALAGYNWGPGRVRELITKEKSLRKAPATVHTYIRRVLQFAETNRLEASDGMGSSA